MVGRVRAARPPHAAVDDHIAAELAGGLQVNADFGARAESLAAGSHVS